VPRDSSISLAGVFRSPWWLRGAHLQTIAPALFAPRARVAYVRERWDTPDGDFIDVDRASPPSGKPSAVLVVFHGLESDTRARYIRGLMRAAVDAGWAGVAPHFRGCGGTINHAPRFYHSGDSDEVDWILRRVAAEARGLPVLAAGISLGGNMLLKWLGERGDEARTIVVAAAGVSAPLDLSAGGAALGRGFNRFYTGMFLRTLKAKSRAKLEQHADLFDRTRMEASRTLHAFDDVVTAPVHGFVDADDYWKRASSKPWLPRIAVPTLILNARNDPFLPPSALPSPAEVSGMVTLEMPSDGGHVGFVDAGPDGVEWMPRHVQRFLAAHVPSTG
jgi:uncharacterized protein